MSVQLKAWIRQAATLSDTALEEELKLINKNSVNAFAGLNRAVGRICRPETDSHTFRSGSYEAHPHADTINLLLSVGDAALSAINSEIPVSPVPYAVSPHMDISARIKVWTRRIVIYKSELPTNNRTNGPMPMYLDKTFSLLKVAF
jgi:type 1 glutamine amidotransferase